MPESKVRKQAKSKQQHTSSVEDAELRSERQRLSGAQRNWVPWVFIPVGLLGVLWMVVYNLAGNSIGFMQSLGDWNVAIGLGLIVASFSLMTLWK
ncbi:cell division protein CrgA [Tessaracoccus antarcticus]|uniref:Cell division protein CrgA n=1 Tax=Tessaracoccus antarcticus TaxID=2479848 RepID=A0A3M0G9R6_9ACTN|nr:cell division protein CrgA [Tessaracoccus antarcticus]RMB61715.1 cell division protein CrgA [Tessaracoccus antarcticus]